MRALATRLAADVKFLGYLEGDALHEIIRGARAMVLPSEWYENAPVSVLEAYALGKPVIGANIGGIPELIRENETGLTFSSGNEPSLTAAMRAIAERSDAQVQEMGRHGRSWVEEQFTADVIPGANSPNVSRARCARSWSPAGNGTRVSECRLAGVSR